MLVSRISQLIALAASTANSTALRFSTGSAPGNPRHVGQTCVFGSPPYLFTQPQNAFDSVRSWTWTSSPITGWYLARTSGDSAVMVDIFILILATGFGLFQTPGKPIRQSLTWFKPQIIALETALCPRLS